jgi:guanylate kinase
MKEYGEVYSNRIELLWLLRNFKRDEEKIARAYDYVINNHLIAHTADDIKDILNENRK